MPSIDWGPWHFLLGEWVGEGAGHLVKELVVDIYSLSAHVSPAFADYVPYWRHNGFWLSDSPDIIRHLSEEHSINLEGTTFFYYEVDELEFGEEERRWTAFEPSPFETKVQISQKSLSA
jgi:hypothetical protein